VSSHSSTRDRKSRRRSALKESKGLKTVASFAATFYVERLPGIRSLGYNKSGRAELDTRVRDEEGAWYVDKSQRRRGRLVCRRGDRCGEIDPFSISL
jgi:hypothetical protein